jgi:hypothetical protein
MARRYLLLLAAGCAAAFAQTEERGNWANYNITNSFETGYRFAEIGGSVPNYRSTVNYGNGIRLFGGSLDVHSIDGKGAWFDELLLNTQGLGNDPYQSATLRIEKNGLYRYDLNWRLNDYYNPAVVTSDVNHLRDTERRWQDHNLTLTPERWLKLRLGYGRNHEDGPAFTSEQGIGTGQQPILPLFTDVRRDFNEYRLGGDVDFLGFRFTVLRRWDFYKEDTPYTALTAGTGVQQFSRAEPYHGTNPSWMGNLSTSRRYWSLNARAVYVAGLRQFVLSENSMAPGGRNNSLSQNFTYVAGNGRRPYTLGDLTFSIFPTRRLTLVENATADSNRIAGDASITQYNFVTAARTTVNFNYLGVRTLSSETTLIYTISNWASVTGGWGYSNRRISTVTSAPGFAGGGGGGGGFQGGGGGPSAQPPQPATIVTADDQKNQLRVGTLGVRLQPLSGLTLSVNGEIGRNDHPFLPISDRNYHTLGGRAEYRVGKLRFAGGYRQVYNVNSPGPITTFASHSRDYSGSATWALRDRLTLDAGYTKLHLDTASGIDYFAGTGQRLQATRGTSVYISNIHAANFGARIAVSRRADLYLGYIVTRDAGDGRSTPVLPGDSGSQAVLDSVQTFPLSYQTPLVRLTVRLKSRLSWNAGWQFYRYRQDFALISIDQNFRANTGFTSVQWSF